MEQSTGNRQTESDAYEPIVQFVQVGSILKSPAIYRTSHRRLEEFLLKMCGTVRDKKWVIPRLILVFSNDKLKHVLMGILKSDLNV